MIYKRRPIPITSAKSSFLITRVLANPEQEKFYAFNFFLKKTPMPLVTRGGWNSVPIATWGATRSLDELGRVERSFCFFYFFSAIYSQRWLFFSLFFQKITSGSNVGYPYDQTPKLIWARNFFTLGSTENLFASHLKKLFSYISVVVAWTNILSSYS